MKAELQKSLAVVFLRHAPLVLCRVRGRLPLVAPAGTKLAFLVLQQEEGAITGCAITLGSGTLKTIIVAVLPFVVVVAVRSISTARRSAVSSSVESCGNAGFNDTHTRPRAPLHPQRRRRRSRRRRSG